MDKKEPNTTFDGIDRILGFFPRIASVLLGATALAYVIGWLYAKAYFAVFGADWLLDELSANTLLGYTWTPVSAFVFLCYLTTLDLEEGEGNNTEKGMSSVVNSGRVIVVLFIILQTAFLAFDWKLIFILVSYTFACVMIFYSAASYGLLVIQLKQKDHKWNLLSTYLTFGIILGAFYLAPTNMGKANAYIDIRKTSDGLPIVKIKNKNNTYRLLYHKNNSYYVFDPETVYKYPIVEVMGNSQIEGIWRYDTERNTAEKSNSYKHAIFKNGSSNMLPAKR